MNMKPTTVTAVLTPEQVAQAFCDMESDRQIEFFAHVKRITEAEYYWPERHWYYMCEQMQGDGMWTPLPDESMSRDAKDVLMSMAAPLYLHTLRFAEAA